MAIEKELLDQLLAGRDGLLLFIMANISGEPLGAIVRDVLPFLWAMIVALAIITFVPETVLWLPRLFGYVG
jgi:C4-dicarboxylate transporter DctM subunit